MRWTVSAGGPNNPTWGEVATLVAEAPAQLDRPAGGAGPAHADARLIGYGRRLVGGAEAVGPLLVAQLERERARRWVVVQHRGERQRAARVLDPRDVYRPP
jgi:hypothetical protein